MIDGDFFKARIRFYKERFKTKSGLFEFFIGTGIWGFLIASISQAIYNFWFNVFNIPIEFIRLLLTYLGVGLTYTFFGIPLSFLLQKIFKVIRKYA